MTTTAARRVAPYGSWESPFPIDWLTVGRVSLGETRWDGDSITWLEGRPEEDGRATLVDHFCQGHAVQGCWTSRNYQSPSGYDRQQQFKICDVERD